MNERAFIFIFTNKIESLKKHIQSYVQKLQGRPRILKKLNILFTCLEKNYNGLQKIYVTS